MEEEVKNKKFGQKLVILLVICTFIGTIMIMLGGYSLLKRNNEEQTDNNESNQATDNTENVKIILLSIGYTCLSQMTSVEVVD